MADYAISNVPRRVVYAGSGTGPYAFTFEILAASDIAVYKNDALLTLTTDYTVTINANGTGSVTLTASAGSAQITIVGAKNIQRTTDFTTGGDFFANSLNDELDNQTIFIQQVAETAERGLKAPVTDPTDINMTLPRRAARINKTLAFDSNGNPTVGEDIGNYRGNWASGTAYVVRDIVKDPVNANIYRVNTAHTSSGSAPLSGNADIAKFDLIVDAASADASADAAAASAALANDWATKTGSAVAGGEFSAKHHAQAAATSASNASTSASNASSSASAASTSASQAATSATNSANSATASANSASAASTSASQAATSATNAANSATAAATSATNSANSATAAAGSASTATTQATNAANSASAASTSASQAATSATNASNSASAASTSATNAANSATAAASSASAADASAVAAAASAASAASTYDQFDDRYLGSKTSNPTVDNDGNALVTGALYYNSVAGKMRVYDGAQWIDASASSQAILVVYQFNASAGQTTFSGTDANGLTLGYTVGSVIITLNGVVLEQTSEVTATNGTSVVLGSAAASGDELNVYAFSTFALADVYTKAQSDAKFVELGGDSMTGSLVFANSTVVGFRNAAGDVVDGSTKGAQIFKFSDNNLYYDNYDNGSHIWRGQGAAERMRIDGSGRVTTPNQPFFLARVGAVYSASGDTTLRADTTLHNVGNHYNTSTWRFTAPVSGVYVFGGNLRANSNIGYVYADPRVNGARVYSSFMFLPGLNTGGAGAGFTAGCFSYALNLNAGDFIETNIGFDVGSVNIDPQSYWFGYLLG